MKQKRLFKAPSSCGASMLLIVAALTMSSCGMFKSGNSQTTASKGKNDVPSSYGNRPKPIPGKPATTNEAARMGYIERFKRIAIGEMERTGVPASIKLAQGLLESDAGRSNLSSNYNNHFGIKCHSDWQGQTFYLEDDDKDPLTGQLIKSCFRVYKNPDESFIAHSEFLRDPRKVNRYGFLFQLQKTDYVGWSEGLQRAGYATASDYSTKLIGLIEDYQLSQYDNYSLKDVVNNGSSGNNNSGMNTGGMANTGGTARPNDDFPTSGFPANNGGQSQGTNRPNGGNQQPTNNNQNNSWLPGWDNAKASDSRPAPQPADTEGVRNDTKFARAYGNMTPYELAGKYGISISDLQTFNEEMVDPRAPLPEGTVVYLQKKRNYWHGTERSYRIRDCETMYDVAQKFGIKLTKLYSKNEMRQGEQPAVGSTILLRRGWFQGADKPALRDTFGEWRRCKMENGNTGGNTNVVNTTRPPNSNGIDFEITPNGSGQPSPNNNPQYYPPQTTTYPPTTTTYPQTTTSYPTTEVVTTYPSSGSTYPSSGSSYPSSGSTYPSSGSSYPSSGSTYPSSGSSYPSSGSTYPTTTTRPSGTKPQAPPAGNRPTTSTATRPTAPPAGRPTTTTTAPRPTTTSAGAQYHTVELKQTLWAISRLYGTTVDKLKELNGLPNNDLKPGQQLRVK